MTFQAIPRDAAGRIALPGRVRRYAVDFAAVTSLPSWLTATAGGGSVTVAGGELQIGSGTNPASPAYVTGPSVATADIEAIVFHVDGQYLTTSVANGQLHQGITTAAAIAGNTGVGAHLHKVTFHQNVFLRGTVGDWPVKDAGASYGMTTLGRTLTVDNNFVKASARTSRSIAIFPRTGMVYALEDRTEVMHARDLASTLVAGTVAPIIYLKAADDGTQQGFRCTGLEVEIAYR